MFRNLISSSLKPAVEKLKRIFGLNAILRRLSNAACSRDFFGFRMLDADDVGREDGASELTSLLDFAFDVSPADFVSLGWAGTVLVTTGLSIDEEVALLPRRAQLAPAGSADASPPGLPGEVS